MTSIRQHGILAGVVIATFIVLGIVGAGLAGGSAGIAAAQGSRNCANPTLYPAPGGQGRIEDLHAVAVVAPNDVWAAGIALGDGAQAPYSVHWLNGAWSRVAMPRPANDYVGISISDLAAIGPSDIWAVGAYFTAQKDYAMTLHWDGTTWQQVAVGVEGSLFGVSGAAPNDVWAVGNYYSEADQAEQALILHWNGTSWVKTAAPQAGSRSQRITGVSARSTDDVWFVGTADGAPRIFHSDGYVFQAGAYRVPPPALTLNGVQVIGDHEAWAAGQAGSDPLLGYYDGDDWSWVQPIHFAPGTIASFNAIAAVAQNDVWAVGNSNVISKFSPPGNPLVMHWDGTAWVVVPNPIPTSFPVAYDAAVSPNGEIWIAGGYVNPSNSNTEGLLTRIQPVSCPPATAQPTGAAPLPTPQPTPTVANPNQEVPPLPGDGSQFFPETGKTVRGIFLDYWRNHGGLAQQGYPISELLEEISDLDGHPYTVQYFERAVFEWHPENQPPYNVLLSQLGKFRYRQVYPNGAPNQLPNRDPGSILFNETGKRLGGRFLEYWQANGGLIQQGLPISDEFKEYSPLDGRPYTVQYFERAVFEWHPENKAPYDVLLSQLGTFRWSQKYGGR